MFFLMKIKSLIFQLSQCPFNSFSVNIKKVSETLSDKCLISLNMVKANEDNSSVFSSFNHSNSFGLSSQDPSSIPLSL